MEACILDKRCIICDEVISNPICPACINKELRDWLMDIKLDLIESNSVTATTQCVICGNDMSICPSCYTSEIYEMLREKDPKIKHEFRTFFNFQLRHNIVE